MKKFKVLYSKLKMRIKLITQSPIIILFKTFKENIEKGNKRKKKFVDFCLVIFFFYFVISLLIYILRMCLEIKKKFYAIFPHCGMSESDFVEKYGQTFQDLTFFQKKKYFIIDFFTWNPEIFIFKILFLFFIFVFCYLVFSVFLKKKKMESEKFFVIKNTDLNLNLLFYHFVVNRITEKLEIEDSFTIAYYKEMKDLIIKNVIELYFIIKMQPAEKLLFVVENYKKILIKHLEKNPNKQQQFAFDNMEENFLTNLTKILEKKKNNKEEMPLLFYDFVKEFSKIKKNEIS